MFTCLQNRVDDGIRSNGSNLSGVSAKCCWSETSLENPIKNGDSQHNRPVISEEGIVIVILWF